MKLIYFLLLFSGGLAIVYYREKLQRFTGNFAFAEKYLGVGGTFRFYLLFGLFITLLSIFYVTGTLDSVLESTVGRFFFRPGE